MGIPARWAKVGAMENHPQGDFLTVAQLLTPTEAHLMRACLEAAGIPAEVADANLVQTHSLLANAL